MLLQILRKALVLVCATVLGKGILLALNGSDTRVERLIADISGHVVSGITSAAASWIIAGAFGLLVLAAWESIGIEPYVSAAFRWVLRRVRRTIPLTEATEIAYEKTAGTVYAGMAERESQRDRDKTAINRWFGWNIWHRVPIYGARYPSKSIERIPAEYQSRAEFVRDSTELRILGETTVYRNLQIKREDFAKYLTQIAEILADNPSLRI